MTGLPQWSEAFVGTRTQDIAALPLPEVRDWAFGGSTGAGVKVAVVDSGVDAGHPSIGEVAGFVAFDVDPQAPTGVAELAGPHEDLVGHGTACAALIRSIAPDVELYSVRVLGASLKGRGTMFLAGLRWAVAQGMAVANLSLSSKSADYFAALHEVCDEAYFRRTMLVAAANNLPGPTYPSQYSSVISVAAMPTEDPWGLAYNPRPPVEFGARGLDVRVPWSGGGSIVASGNSFAAPHVSGMVALMLAKHPDLTPFQVKAVLQALTHTADPS